VPIKSNLRQYNKLKAALVAMAVTMQDYRVTDADIAVWIREFDKDGDGDDALGAGAHARRPARAQDVAHIHANRGAVQVESS
jgi:hypothetical protein